MPIHREPRCAVCWPTIPATFEGAGGAKLFVDSVATQCASGDAQGNILSSEVLPLTLAARGVPEEAWDALVGDLRELPPIGLAPGECRACLCALPAFLAYSVTGLPCLPSYAMRPRVWRERAAAVALRHTPAFAVHGVSLRATVAEDGTSGWAFGQIPWRGSCVEFEWEAPATAIVPHDGRAGDPEWRAAALQPADARCVRVPVPPEARPGSRLQASTPTGEIFFLQVPHPKPPLLCVQVPTPGDLELTRRRVDPAAMCAAGVGVPTLNQLAAGRSAAAPGGLEMGRPPVGAVVGVPGGEAAAAAVAGPPAAAASAAAVRRNSAQVDLETATVQRVSISGDDRGWQDYAADAVEFAAKASAGVAAASAAVEGASGAAVGAVGAAQTAGAAAATVSAAAASAPMMCAAAGAVGTAAVTGVAVRYGIDHQASIKAKVSPWRLFRRASEAPEPASPPEEPATTAPV